MSQKEVYSCVSDCTYFKAVKGTCTHGQRQSLRDYLQRNPADQCPLQRTNNS